jgi:hypothetical protein
MLQFEDEKMDGERKSDYLLCYHTSPENRWRAKKIKNEEAKMRNTKNNLLVVLSPFCEIITLIFFKAERQKALKFKIIEVKCRN